MRYATTENRKLTTLQMTTAALMTALLCIIGPIALPLPVSPVPVTLATLVIYLMAYVLGMRLGVASCALYLLIGAVGLPVFSGFSGGIGKMAGPTGGYMIGYLFLALIAGYFAERFPGKIRMQAAGMVLGTAVCYLFGTLWLSGQLKISFAAGLGVGAIPYLPGDAAKIIAAALLGPALKKAVGRAA